MSRSRLSGDVLVCFLQFEVPIGQGCVKHLTSPKTNKINIIIREIAHVSNWKVNLCEPHTIP